VRKTAGSSRLCWCPPGSTPAGWRASRPRPQRACLPDTIRWFASALDVEALTKEVADAANRISVLVGAVKQYAQLDLAPLQHVDLHELIDSTLLILGGKIGDAVTVVRDFDPALPRIDAYAAELNQVWSNLIDNALYAMSGAGTLIVRTRPGHDRVVVEVIDTGSGLSA
jgi:signal transduction histidine kinase